MEIWSILSTIVIILLVGMGILFFLLNKKGEGKRKGPDYYTFLIMGLIWIVIGIPFNNKFLWISGIVFFVIGLINKKRWKQNRFVWKDLDKKDKMLRLWFIGIGLLLLILAFLILFLVGINTNNSKITNFQECIDAGYPAMESYPRQCNDGENAYIEDLVPLEILNAAQNSECTEKGFLGDSYNYNNNSKTWWIDLTMKPEFENPLCNPACVIDEEILEAKIKYMCTGALI